MGGKRSTSGSRYCPSFESMGTLKKPLTRRLPMDAKRWRCSGLWQLLIPRTSELGDCCVGWDCATKDCDECRDSRFRWTISLSTTRQNVFHEGRCERPVCGDPSRGAGRPLMGRLRTPTPSAESHLQIGVKSCPRYRTFRHGRV